MNISELRKHLCAIYPDLCPLFSIEFGDGLLAVECKTLHAAASNLKELGFDRLGMVTAVDHSTEFEMVYRLHSRSMSAGIFLKCGVKRDDPRVLSVSDLWPAAIWQEREVYDMFGIVFLNHPDMRRILLPEDWEGFPLRKDYVDERIVRRPDYI